MELLSYKGVVSALITPSRDYREKMAELIDFQLKRGIRGFFVLGTMGEGVKLGRETRCEVAEAAVEYVGSRGIVIVHVGAADLDTVKISCETCLENRRQRSLSYCALLL
jgi:N-acetylneuraminate lyase